MKTLFKTIFLSLIFILATALAVNAQSAFTFGAKVGANYSNNVGVDNSDPKFGLNFGVTMDVRLSRNIYLLTALEYTVKGSKGDNYRVEEDVVYSTKETPTYLQIPIHVGYMLPVSREVRLIFHAGPFMAYGIGGKNDRKWSNGNSDKIDFFGVGVGKFDWGLGLGVNAEYNRFVASLGYDRGLRNYIPDYNDGKSRTSNFYFTIGYLF